MKLMRVTIPLIYTVLLTTGCVELQVTPVTADSKGPLNGIPYYLPFTQFELTVSRTLKQCLDAGGTIQLTYDTKVAVVSTSAQPDPGQEYLIDLTSLSSFWKTSDLKTNLFPGGMLQQINASASDQTAQIIQNTASGIGSIAAHIVTGGLGAAVADQPKCKQAATNALSQHNDGITDKALQTATDQLNKDTAVLKAWTTAAASMGARLDSATQKLIADAVTQVNQDIAKQAAAQKPAADYQKALTVSQTFRWPVSGTLDTPANSPLYQEVTLPGGTTALKQWVDKLNPADSYFITHLRLQRLPGAELLPPSSVTTGSSGIRYRVPARGQLILCQIEPNEGSTHESIDNQLPPCANAGNLARTLPATADAIWEGMAAQLGRVQYLPYKNGPFQNNTLSATFNQDGTLSSAEYSEPSSSGVAASNTLNTVATTAGQAAKSIVTAPTTKINAELAQIQAQNNLVSAQATATTAEDTALANANAALLNALASQANAQAALKKAQASATAGSLP